MTEYIIDFDEKSSAYMRILVSKTAMNKGEIVRCRDCRHATISSLGLVKYCEMFVLPDEDGYGADPQVMLPLDFFCGYGELRGDAE